MTLTISRSSGSSSRTYSFGGAHRDNVFVCAFIKMIIYTYLRACVYVSQKKSSEIFFKSLPYEKSLEKSVTHFGCTFF
jgi:hypothetical protein